MFIMTDAKNIVVDAASLLDSLSEHNVKNKDLTLIELEEDLLVFVGDEYDPENNMIIKRPENHVKPSTEELAEIQIQAEMRRLAVANLKAKGTIPADYVDANAVAEVPVVIENEKS